MNSLSLFEQYAAFLEAVGGYGNTSQCRVWVAVCYLPMPRFDASARGSSTASVPLSVGVEAAIRAALAEPAP